MPVVARRSGGVAAAMGMVAAWEVLEQGATQEVMAVNGAAPKGCGIVATATEAAARAAIAEVLQATAIRGLDMRLPVARR